MPEQRLELGPLVALLPEWLAGLGIEGGEGVGVFSLRLVKGIDDAAGHDGGAVGIADRLLPRRLQVPCPRGYLLGTGAVAVGPEKLWPVGGRECEGEGEREC